jgi:hypothetical protein
MIPPPGLQSFHQVSYPSLMHRFGVTSSSFIDAYHYLSAEDLEDSASTLFFDQVFTSILVMSFMNSFVFFELLIHTFRQPLFLPVLFQSLGAIR